MTNLSFTTAIEDAWAHTRRILFPPFDAAKWFVIGFGAWLSSLGEQGGTLNFNLPFNQFADTPPHAAFAQIRSFIDEHMTLVLTIGSVILMLLLLFSILIIWLNSRGKFVLVDNVTQNRGAISGPWHTYAMQGNSLFLWRIGFSAIAIIISLLFIAAAIFLFLPCYYARAFLPLPGGSLVLVILAFITFTTALSYIALFLNDFIVPIMMAKGIRTTAAWLVLIDLMNEHLWSFLTYGLVKFLLKAGTMLAFGLIMLFTCCLCCVGAVVLLIPYLNAVLLLPFTLFLRAFSLCWLEQFGPDFILFQQSGATVEPIETPPQQ